jgi:hypothetical protein
MPVGLATVREVVEWVCLVLAMCVASQLVFELSLRRRAGGPLLDLGPIVTHPTMLFAIGGFYVLCGLEWLLFTSRHFLGLVFVVLGVSQLVRSAQHFQICQAGVLGTGFFGTRLFRWEDIASYELKGSGTLSLKLRGKGWVTCRPKVSRHYREEAEALLRSRCPTLENRVEA